MIRAGEIRTENFPFDERVPLVRARVLDGVDLPVDTEDGDRVTVARDERAPVGLERGERDREPLHRA